MICFKIQMNVSSCNTKCLVSFQEHLELLANVVCLAQWHLWRQDEIDLDDVATTAGDGTNGVDGDEARVAVAGEGGELVEVVLVGHLAREGAGLVEDVDAPDTEEPDAGEEGDGGVEVGRDVLDEEETGKTDRVGDDVVAVIVGQGKDHGGLGGAAQDEGDGLGEDDAAHDDQDGDGDLDAGTANVGEGGDTVFDQTCRGNEHEAAKDERADGLPVMSADRVFGVALCGRNLPLDDDEDEAGEKVETRVEKGRQEDEGTGSEGGVDLDSKKTNVEDQTKSRGNVA